MNIFISSTCLESYSPDSEQIVNGRHDKMILLHHEYNLMENIRLSRLYVKENN